MGQKVAHAIVDEDTTTDSSSDCQPDCNMNRVSGLSAYRDHPIALKKQEKMLREEFFIERSRRRLAGEKEEARKRKMCLENFI